MSKARPSGKEFVVRERLPSVTSQRRKKMPNADALQQLAHATHQRSPLMASPLQALVRRGVNSIVSSNFYQMLIRIIHVKSWCRTSGARFNSWTEIVTDRMVRIAIWDSLGFHSRECFIKGFA